MVTLFGAYAPLVLHVLGDYVTQSDWMAQQKTSSWAPAVVHGAVYSTPFLLLTQSWVALAFIFGTHVIIDHWRLARYICWAKNFIAPPSGWPQAWSECKGTGYNPETPPFLATWLMIITDNFLHVVCNAIALTWL